MYSPLTTRALRAAPRRTQLLATKTPVSMPAHALETSIGVALVAPMAEATATLIGGSSHSERPSRYFVMLQLITRSMSSASPSHLDRQSRAASDREGEGVLLARRHPALLDAGEPLEIDTGLVPSGRHERRRREMGRWQRPPDTGEPRHMRRAFRVGALLLHEPVGHRQAPIVSVSPSTSSLPHYASRAGSAMVDCPGWRDVERARRGRPSRW